LVKLSPYASPQYSRQEHVITQSTPSYAYFRNVNIAYHFHTRPALHTSSHSPPLPPTPKKKDQSSHIYPIDSLRRSISIFILCLGLQNDHFPQSNLTTHKTFVAFRCTRTSLIDVGYGKSFTYSLYIIASSMASIQL